MEPADLKRYLKKKVMITRKPLEGPIAYAGRLSRLPKDDDGDIILTDAWDTETPGIKDRMSIPFSEIRDCKLYVDAHPYVSPYYTPKR